MCYVIYNFLQSTLIIIETDEWKFPPVLFLLLTHVHSNWFSCSRLNLSIWNAKQSRGFNGFRAFLNVFVMTFSLIKIADDVCELKINNNNEVMFLSINETWSSAAEPCTLYKCTDKSGIDVQRRECDTSCNEDQVYKTLPGECCGKCFTTFCAVDEKKFKVGEIWKGFDNCTVNECIDTGTDLIVTSYKKNCPQLKNCPPGNIEMRDCCPYCNFRSQSEFNLR